MISLLIAAAIAAPAPPPRKPPPPLQVVAGEYTLHWGSAAYTMYLNEAGGYNVPPAWSGNWSWCARTRTLKIAECESGGEYRQWSATLGRDLSGIATYRDCTLPIRLERKEQGK